jgi:hypothetical protein
MEYRVWNPSECTEEDARVIEAEDASQAELTAMTTMSETMSASHSEDGGSGSWSGSEVQAALSGVKSCYHKDDCTPYAEYSARLTDAIERARALLKKWGPGEVISEPFVFMNLLRRYAPSELVAVAEQRYTDHLSVCSQCYGHGSQTSYGQCPWCRNGIVGPLGADDRVWAEYFHGDLMILWGSIREYQAAGFDPSHAHAAWLFGWPAASGIVDIETMRAHALRMVKVELVSRRSA